MTSLSCGRNWKLQCITYPRIVELAIQVASPFKNGPEALIDPPTPRTCDGV